MFTLTTDSDAMNGTSNLSYIIIGPGKLQQLAQITPATMEVAFGPGDEGCDDPDKGYTEPEWYFTTETGTVMGIGWRWGTTRLRGKNTHDQVDPPGDIAAAFLQYVIDEIEASLDSTEVA